MEALNERMFCGDRCDECIAEVEDENESDSEGDPSEARHSNHGHRSFGEWVVFCDFTRREFEGKHPVKPWRNWKKKKRMQKICWCSQWLMARASTVLLHGFELETTNGIFLATGPFTGRIPCS